MKKVYIAGAISANKLEQGINNIRQGIIAGVELLKLGYAPYIPHLDYQLNLVQNDVIPVEIYYKYDLEWLSVCDCMLVLPNSETSKGVKGEIEFAQKNGIPIYYSLEDLKNSKKERKEFSYEDYIKVLSLAKQNSNCFEYCLKGNDKYIAELKEKLKPFEDEYFRGLTNQDIAELAKKSIRLTKENRDLMDRIEDLEKQLAEVKEQVNSIEIEEIKKGIRQIPKYCEKYFYLDSNGSIYFEIWTGDEADLFRFNTGNCFKTEQETQDYKENLLTKQSLKDLVLELNDGTEIDWKNPHQSKYYLLFDQRANYLGQSSLCQLKEQNIYCLNNEYLTKAKERIGEEKLIKLIKSDV